MPSTNYSITITSAGNGTITTNFQYVEGTNQNATGHGLGIKTSIAVEKNTYTGPSTAPSQTQLLYSRLADITGGVSEQFGTGSWFVVYVGVCTGNQLAKNGTVDPSGCEPFSGADNVGQYTGEIIVTTTAN
ncbi:MAG: hypothetical protein HQL13_05130 [Candidatus Omnitrophica bacterium]|nr:hypothetical protein [Candidatus Omnitrophota bacterium]